MLNEFQSVGVEIICAVLAASVFVAQCVAQEVELAAARVRKDSRK